MFHMDWRIVGGLRSHPEIYNERPIEHYFLFPGFLMVSSHIVLVLQLKIAVNSEIKKISSGTAR